MKINVKITRKENADFFNVKIDDIVEVEFEDYVAAVVASELASGNLEACKAQAIASRTFAISRGVLNGTPISDASGSAQAYRASRNDKDKYPKCVQATQETAGYVLYYGKGPASTVFSASNGGRTYSSQEVWGGVRAYLPAQEDPWDAATGAEKNGHGVGMSQRGARYAASQGVSYIDILKFYYPNTVLKQNYGEGAMATINEKAEKVISAAKSQLGNPYVYGTWGTECTPAMRKKYARLNPEHQDNIYKKCLVLSGKGNCEQCQWKGKLAFDCRGFTYWCLTQVGIVLAGGGATSQYNNANNWQLRGEVKDMPNVVCCVFKYNKTTGKMAHTGLHIGDGEIIHCSCGVETGSLGDRTWTHFAVPTGLYSELPEEKVKVMTTLRKGMSGADVAYLQNALTVLGYDCGTVDGKFGAKTFEAVKQFQADCHLTADGVVGTKSWAALERELAEVEKEESEPATDWTAIKNELAEIKNRIAAIEKMLQ